MAEKHYLHSELESLITRDAAMWNFICAGSLDGVWYWDLENPENEWMSPEFWALFGHDPVSKRHDPAEWQEMIFKEDLQHALDNFHKHCADPSHPYDQIVRYRHKNGSTVWVRCRGIAIRNEDGKPVRMLGAHNDVTALKLSEERANQQIGELDTATREVKESNHELRTFAYGVSHDLKSPANTLAMILAEINNDADGLSDKQKMLLGMGIKTVERMRTLIEELLAYTRLIGEDLNEAEIDLDALLDGIAASMQTEIDLSQTSIVKKDLGKILGNESQIEILFQNLLTNAIKYRHAERAPVITIENRRSAKNEIELNVNDNGMGIPQEQKSRIFEMFERLHRYDEIAGTGLGLTICKRVAHNHGGDIDVESVEGEGSTFTLRLPGQD